MNLDTDRISLAHVHAYVDAQLDDRDCQRMEDYFDANPEKFDQLQRYLEINDHYQAMYNSVLGEPIPESMLTRIYGGTFDPFQSAGGLDLAANKLSSLLSTQWSQKWSVKAFGNSGAWTAAIKELVFSGLRLQRSEEPFSLREQAEDSSFAKLLKTFKLHPQTAPTWLSNFSRQAATRFAQISAYYRDLNRVAAVSIIAIGIIIGMFLHTGSDTPAQTQALTSPVNQTYAESQATQAHLFYRKEGRFALETDKDKEQQLLNWVSGRLGKEIRLVDFSEMGYSNVGMMLVPAQDNFAMVTVYENEQSQKLTLYIGLGGGNQGQELGCTARETSKSLCSWVNGSLQFVVVSDLPVEETNQLAQWMKQNYTMAHLISSSEYFFSQTLGTINA